MLRYAYWRTSIAVHCFVQHLVVNVSEVFNNMCILYQCRVSGGIMQKPALVYLVHVCEMAATIHSCLHQLFVYRSA